MQLFSWLKSGNNAKPSRTKAQRATRVRLGLEALEERMVPASYTAATTADLIADIKAANTAGGANTITLAANTNFILTAANNSTDGANGLPVIKGKNGGDNLTIIGNGDSIVRSAAAGTPAFRLFDVATGNSLTLQNVTLQNGLAQGTNNAGQGGAILNSGTLKVSSSTLSNNSALLGGGISNGGTGPINNSSTLIIDSGSTVSNNSASYGGGIYNFGNLTVTNSVLSGNTSTHNGGGIFSIGTVTISGSTLSNNVATWLGGGIINGGSLTVSDSTLTDNAAGRYGGGISNNSGTLTVSNSTLSGNSATIAGGGIFNFATVIVKNSSNITGNATPAGSGADADNLGVIDEDSSSIIAILDGKAALPI